MLGKKNVGFSSFSSTCFCVGFILLLAVFLLRKNGTRSSRPAFYRFY